MTLDNGWDASTSAWIADMGIAIRSIFMTAARMMAGHATLMAAGRCILGTTLKNALSGPNGAGFDAKLASTHIVLYDASTRRWADPCAF